MACYFLLSRSYSVLFLSFFFSSSHSFSFQVLLPFIICDPFFFLVGGGGCALHHKPSSGSYVQVELNSFDAARLSQYPKSC